MIELVETGETPSRSLLESPGRLLAIDLGAKRVGVAVSDELRITVSPLQALERRSWKDLLRRVSALLDSFAVKGLVIGLPLKLEGHEGSAAKETHVIAEKFRRSLTVPVFLQDERLTTLAATANLKSEGQTGSEVERLVDSEAAAIILRDFIANNASPTELNHR